jgi:hypothetical protein
MARLIDATRDRPLGDVTEADLALLERVLPAGEGGRRTVDNDAFLALVDVGASSAMLDAVKSILDVEGKAEVRWEHD